MSWLEREFEWSERTAQRMMATAQRFKLPTVGSLPIEPGVGWLDVQGVPLGPDGTHAGGMCRGAGGA
jgi:hypothetical protein